MLNDPPAHYSPLTARTCARLAAALLAGAALSLIAVPARAAILDIADQSGWTRGSAGSTYQEWDIFVNPDGPNAPNSPGVTPPDGAFPADVAAVPFNPNGIADVGDASASAFITSGGNIYSPTAAIDLNIDVPNYNESTAAFTTVVLQVDTQGTSLTEDSVLLGGLAPDAAAIHAEEELGGFGGLKQSWWFQWTLPGNADSYHFDVLAAEASLSIDKVAVDTIFAATGQQAFTVTTPTAVPEPASWMLAAVAGLLLGTLGVIRRRRLRNNSSTT